MLTLARQSKQDAKQESYYLQQAEDISKYLLSLINESWICQEWKQEN